MELTIFSALMLGIMGWIWWLVFGLIAGLLAKWIMPGKDPGGIIVTILIGIGGSILGGWIAGMLNIEGAGNSDVFNWINMVFALVGALIILFIWKKVIAPMLDKG